MQKEINDGDDEGGGESGSNRQCAIIDKRNDFRFLKHSKILVKRRLRKPNITCGWHFQNTKIVFLLLKILANPKFHGIPCIVIQLYLMHHVKRLILFFMFQSEIILLESSFRR